MRYLILALIVSLSACTAPRVVEAPKPPQPPPTPVVAPAPKPEPPKPEPPKPEPKNLVCEAFKGVNDKAVCTPYLTEANTHTAMITLGGQQIHCAYTLKGVECHDPIVIVQQPPPPTQDTKPAAKKPAKKK